MLILLWHGGWWLDFSITIFGYPTLLLTYANLLIDTCTTLDEENFPIHVHAVSISIFFTKFFPGLALWNVAHFDSKNNSSLYDSNVLDGVYMYIQSTVPPLVDCMVSTPSLICISVDALVSLQTCQTLNGWCIEGIRWLLDERASVGN